MIVGNLKYVHDGTLGRALRLEDDIEGVDDAGEPSEAAEDDVDQKTAAAVAADDNGEGREQECSNESQQPSSVFSAASLALPLTFALSFAISSTHVDCWFFKF